MAARLPLHAAHEAAGALFEERGAHLLPARYGPPGAEAAEYEAARAGAALIDLGERDVLEATGPERQKFLQGMLSNDVLNRPAGEGCCAALMTARGHLQALIRVLVARDAVLLELPAERMALVEQTLVHYRVAAPVRFKTRSTAVLGLVGPQALERLRGAGAEVSELGPESHVSASLAGQTVLVARASDLPPTGYVLHVNPDGAAAAWSALVAAGARPLGRRAMDALRVEAGRPWYGPDVSEENLLHETGLVAECHSPTKGCYIGQEVVARLEARGGNVNKQLRGLRLSAAVSPGASVVAEAKEVGRVTTAAVSPRLGPIALAYVHRSAVEAGTAVAVAGATATVENPPFEA